MKRSAWDVHDTWMDVVYDSRGMEQPSMINRDTGERLMSKRWLKDVDPQTLYWIKKHEEGHYVLQTDFENDLTNEKLADTHAFYETMKKYNSLSGCVDALSYVLECIGRGADEPDYQARVAHMMRLAENYDYYVNGNERVKMN